MFPNSIFCSSTPVLAPAPDLQYPAAGEPDGQELAEDAGGDADGGGDGSDQTVITFPNTKRG